VKAGPARGEVLTVVEPFDLSSLVFFAGSLQEGSGGETCGLQKNCTGGETESETSAGEGAAAADEGAGADSEDDCEEDEVARGSAWERGWVARFCR